MAFTLTVPHAQTGGRVLASSYPPKPTPSEAAPLKTHPAKAAQRVQRSRGHEVGGGEHGVDTRPVIDEAAQRVLTRHEAEVPVGDHARIEGTRRRQGATVAEQPVDAGRHVRRPGDRGDGPSAAIEQVSDRGAGAADVVGVDIRQRVPAGDRPPAQHER
jgi:hypothetical protein